MHVVAVVWKMQLGKQEVLVFLDECASLSQLGK